MHIVTDFITCLFLPFQDGNLILFLPQRELTVNEDGVEPLMGVALIHESILKKTEIKVFLQIVLIFR